MPYIDDYLKWRGDLSFSQAPFNEIDAAILSTIVYIDYSALVPSDPFDPPVRMRDVGIRYFFDREKDTPLGVTLTASIMKMFRAIYLLPRYANIGMTAFSADTSITEERQFGALTFRLTDTESAVVLRGTDDSLVGWLEDCNLARMSVISAQSCTKAYFERVSAAIPGRFYICGHSKGGNLAAFTAATVSPELQDRILGAYSLDGPGFYKGFVEQEGYQRVKDKIFHIIPQGSIVGTFFYSADNDIVVRSTNVGVFQHDPCSWRLMRDCFERVPEGLTVQAKRNADNFNARVASMSAQQIDDFVETFFGVLESTGATTLSELTNHALLKMASGIRALNTLDKRTKDNMNSVMAQLIRIRIFTHAEERSRTKEEKEAEEKSNEKKLLPEDNLKE